MKFGKDVLLEIVAIVQDALVNGTDASQKLREIDVREGAVDGEPVIVLTEQYKRG